MKDIVIFSWASLISFLGWFFGGLNGALTLLIVLSIIDYLSGVCVGCCEHNISSSVGFRGIARKCLMFAFIGVANLIDRYMVGENAATKVIVCLFYISNEGISILENAHKLGLPIPKILSQYFSNMNKKNNNKTVK